MNHLRALVIITVALVLVYIASYFYSALPSTQAGAATVRAASTNATATASAEYTATAAARRQ